jgi:hypothetical protein
MQFRTDRHPSDEVLEQYSMGRLDERTSQAFEEHFLICSRCQDNLAFTDAFRKGMQSAALELRREAGVAGLNAGPREASGFRGLFALPAPVWALGMAALVFLAVAGSRWSSLHQSMAQPALVLLQSNRGAGNPLESSVPAAKPFILVLDAKDLSSQPRYRLEIVDGANREVFGSSAVQNNNQLRATVTKGLPKGDYYVRVYGTELLREYSLHARN